MNRFLKAYLKNDVPYKGFLLNYIPFNLANNPDKCGKTNQKDLK